MIASTSTARVVQARGARRGVPSTRGASVHIPPIGAHHAEARCRATRHTRVLVDDMLLQRRGVVVSRAVQGDSTTQSEVLPPTPGPTSVVVSLEASALRVSLLLELLPEGRGQAVVVTGVLEGSEADKAGIVPGQKLLAVSDPIRPGEMWSCGDRPSLRFVKDTFTATRNKTIQIELSAKPLFTAASLVAPPPPSSSSLSSMGSLSSMSDGEGDAPATNGPRPKSDVQKRIERRKDYMEVVDQRDDRGFVTIAALLFLGPAVAILTWAYFSGYLDSMYMNSLTTSQ